MYWYVKHLNKMLHFIIKIIDNNVSQATTDFTIYCNNLCSERSYKYRHVSRLMQQQGAK